MPMFECIPITYAEKIIRELFRKKDELFNLHCLYSGRGMIIEDRYVDGQYETWVLHPSCHCGECTSGNIIFQFDRANNSYRLCKSTMLDDEWRAHSAVDWMDSVRVGWLYVKKWNDYRLTSGVGYITSRGEAILLSSFFRYSTREGYSHDQINFCIKLVPNSDYMDKLVAIFREHSDEAIVLDFRPEEEPVVIVPSSIEEPTPVPEPPVRPAPQPEATDSKPPENTTKGSATMKGFDFTMRQLSDENIASTMLGIAVKVGDSWRIYDKAKKEITDLGDVQFGNFPLWVIPALKLTPGDIIIDGNKYYCVTSKNDRIQTVDIATGKTHSIVPVKNILGFSVYQKVMAVTDALGLDADMGDLADDNTLMLMAMMSGCLQGGEAQGGAMGMQGLLPFLLFRGELGNLGDNKLPLIAMMGMGGAGGQQNDLLQLLLMKKLLLGDKPTEPTTK